MLQQYMDSEIVELYPITETSYTGHGTGSQFSSTR